MRLAIYLKLAGIVEKQKSVDCRYARFDPCENIQLCQNNIQFDSKLAVLDTVSNPKLNHEDLPMISSSIAQN